MGSSKVVVRLQQAASKHILCFDFVTCTFFIRLLSHVLVHNMHVTQEGSKAALQQSTRPAWSARQVLFGAWFRQAADAPNKPSTPASHRWLGAQTGTCTGPCLSLRAWMCYGCCCLLAHTTGKHSCIGHRQVWSWSEQDNRSFKFIPGVRTQKWRCFKCTSERK